MYDFFWIRENILHSILTFYIVHIFQPRVFSVQGRGLPRSSNSHRVIKFTLSLSINSFDQFCLYLLTIQIYTVYDSFSDVGESRVWIASKNLTPCRMHLLKYFLIAQIIAKCHSFPNMYGML